MGNNLVGCGQQTFMIRFWDKIIVWVKNTLLGGFSLVFYTQPSAEMLAQKKSSFKSREIDHCLCVIIGTQCKFWRHTKH